MNLFLNLSLLIMKIGLVGKMSSGKTTLANQLKNQDDKTIVLSFGTKVKEIAKDLFQMEGKNRRLLQEVGTKMREINNNVWVNYVKRQIDTLPKESNIIIDDVRYENEFKYLKDNGFCLIYLDITLKEQRKRLLNKYKPEDGHLENLEHPSEQVEKLRDKCDKIIGQSLNLYTVSKLLCS